MPVLAYTALQWTILISLIVVGLLLKVFVLTWLHRDLVRRKREPLPWIVVGLFADLIVLIVWLVVRPPLERPKAAQRPTAPGAARPEGARRATATFGAPAPTAGPSQPAAPAAGPEATCDHCGAALGERAVAASGTPVACPTCGLFTTIR